MRSLSVILFLTMAICLALWPSTGAALPGRPFDAVKKAFGGGKKDASSQPANSNSGHGANPKKWSNADMKAAADRLENPKKYLDKSAHGSSKSSS
ncbi:hypothetical protein HRG_008998 [Hirsutella rhossiliensis]|uniref:Uncharacterized protein n=1 Tax=Hirsutella rhossiliensis TaxID=111463 RepID=A0A9P8MRZ1_9HYPO|nr:uncharacterized protein HRG_08998 [Hirsutella rhossiliensis]KAH0959977.1 hypothetical protein HRG_08998 [Hirsutella rhossiliensis]